MSLMSSFKGWLGETVGALSQKLRLDSETYHAINNVTIPTSDGTTTQIDHVIVSRFGIFVVESKTMKGWIFGDAKSAQWTQSLPGGRKFRFQNPLRQNFRHTKALSEFLGIDHELFHSVVMFWGECEFKTPMPDNVLSTGYTAYIKSKREILFPQEEVVFEIRDTLKAGRLPPTWATRRQHIAGLRKRNELRNQN